MEVEFFMFNVEDNELIMKIIDARKDDELVIPLYIKVGNAVYSIFDVNEIQYCSRSIFKIGFGSSSSVFSKMKFPNDKLLQFSNARLFNHFDDDKQINVQYIVFESDNVEDDNTILSSNINDYYDMLFEYVMECVEINKRERIKKTMEELS